ncbi:RNA helicase [Fusarium sp. LHS14.1]|nr:RNA helicase [Fusarium sp. LHS14.1]
MRFPLRPGVVRPPLCHIAATRRLLSTTPRFYDDTSKTKTKIEPPQKNPMSRGKLKAMLAATVDPRQKNSFKGRRPSQINHGKGHKPRMRWESKNAGKGRHAMFRQTVFNRFEGVLQKFSKSSVSVTGVGEEELDKQAALFMDVLEKAFIMAEQNVTQRDRNPLFWNLRDAFILKDVKGLSNELQYSFQSFLIRQRFSKGLEESHKRLLDFRFPYEWFPATRTMQRTIHLHVGPTNSGKTYRALKALENSKRGVYAGPLRLLANEVYQRLQAKGLPCALMTGEEVRIPQDTDTYFTSCTVEMIPVNEPYDVAVIDEIQMIADPDRGSGWTTALLGVMAKEVHLCGEERTVKLIQSICAAIGDECIVHRYERLSPLETMSEAIDEDYNRLEKGDAIVAFSRMNLHALKTTIEKHTGRRCAIIYGSLPPEVRVQQAALFNDPNNDYDFIVASDAIGMGLNLEIRRVILDSVTKYDGNQNRHLTYPELKQIGGRAGRYRTARQATEADSGADDGRKVGYVTTMARQDLKNVHRAFRSNVDDIDCAYVTPPAAAVERFSTYFPKDTPLSFILMRIRELASVSKNFRLGIAPDKLEIADAIQHIPLTIYDRLTLCHLPVWQRAENSMDVLRALATIISENGRGDLLSIKEIPLEFLDIDLRNFKGTPIDYLHKLESLHVAINQYVWLSYRFSGMFRDQALAFHVRSLVEQKLVDTLERLDFTQSDLQSIRTNKRLMAQSQKNSRKVLGEGDLKDIEQEMDDPPLDQDEHWEPHQTSEEVAATASAP